MNYTKSVIILMMATNLLATAYAQRDATATPQVEENIAANVFHYNYLNHSEELETNYHSIIEKQIDLKNILEKVQEEAPCLNFQNLMYFSQAAAGLNLAIQGGMTVFYHLRLFEARVIQQNYIGHYNNYLRSLKIPLLTDWIIPGEEALTAELEGGLSQIINEIEKKIGKALTDLERYTIERGIINNIVKKAENDAYQASRTYRANPTRPNSTYNIRKASQRGRMYIFQGEHSKAYASKILRAIHNQQFYGDTFLPERTFDLLRMLKGTVFSIGDDADIHNLLTQGELTSNPKIKPTVPLGLHQKMKAVIEKVNKGRTDVKKWIKKFKFQSIKLGGAAIGAGAIFLYAAYASHDDYVSRSNATDSAEDIFIQLGHANNEQSFNYLYDQLENNEEGNYYRYLSLSLMKGLRDALLLPASEYRIDQKDLDQFPGKSIEEIEEEMIQPIPDGYTGSLCQLYLGENHSYCNS